jgi:hypothetical protein
MAFTWPPLEYNNGASNPAITNELPPRSIGSGSVVAASFCANFDPNTLIKVPGANGA